MFSLTRLAQIGYVLGLALLLSLMLLPNSSKAQIGLQQIGPNHIGISGGFRATPALPTIVIPVISFSVSGATAASGGSGGLFGAGGGASGGSASATGSLNTSLVSIDLGSFFPNNGQIIGLPPPTLMPPLNNLMYGPFFSNTTGAPYAQLLAMNSGGAVGAIGGVGGAAGAAGAGGLGMGGVGGIGGAGGGFAGKGMGGFNGKKPL